MKINQIKETCLYVKDLDRTAHFYHDVLGLPLISKVPDRHVFFRAGTSVLLCFNGETTKHETVLPPHYASGRQHLAFEVSAGDYHRTLKELMGAGIEITHREKWADGRFESFYFEDPDGHVLEVVPEGMWG